MSDNRVIKIAPSGSGNTVFTLGDGSPITQYADRATPPEQSPPGTNVFVVHGHDHARLAEVAETITRLGLNPVILREQSEGGRTLIEKFEDHAVEAAFAVVVVTPDDFGRGGTETTWPSRPNRARQNVILEMGYFMGKLGRARTAALYVPGTELPSDLHGLLYIAWDEHWQRRLANEMRDAGLPLSDRR